jgi:hypothetical protein
VLEQVRSSHAKTQRLGKQVCDAAARGPLPGGPTGDFWLPDELNRLVDPG